MSLNKTIYDIVSTNDEWVICRNHCGLTVTCDEDVLKKVADLLRSNGHNCLRRRALRSISWCGCEDECGEVATLRDMQSRQAAQEAFAKKLTDEGHRCVCYLESYPVQIRWCNKTPCARALTN